MNQNVRAPLPGESIFYYCPECKKRFQEKVEDFGLLKIFSKPKTVKCPDCGNSCFPDKTIKY